MGAGDLMVLPAGIYHRFSLDMKNRVRTMRLFKVGVILPVCFHSETDRLITHVGRAQVDCTQPRTGDRPQPIPYRVPEGHQGPVKCRHCLFTLSCIVPRIPGVPRRIRILL